MNKIIVLLFKNKMSKIILFYWVRFCNKQKINIDVCILKCLILNRIEQLEGWKSKSYKRNSIFMALMKLWLLALQLIILFAFIIQTYDIIIREYNLVSIFNSVIDLIFLYKFTLVNFEKKTIQHIKYKCMSFYDSNKLTNLFLKQCGKQ